MAVAATRGWAASPTLSRTSYLQNVQTNRASILWTSPVAGAGKASITGTNGTTIDLPATRKVYLPADTNEASTFYQYQVDVSGLQPATLYNYRVNVDGTDLAADQFRTAPASGNFSFLAFGDSGEDTPEQQTLINLMLAEPGVAMIAHLGDLSYPYGDYPTYEDSYFRMNAPLMRRLPFFPTPGNHDVIMGIDPYLNIHATPASNVPAGDEGRYYSFDWGDVHFATLDTNLLSGADAGRMLQWLDLDLGATQKFWRIVYFHHPPYPTGSHIDDPLCLLCHSMVTPIVERHAVQLVLSGHEHAYERTFPLAADNIVKDGLGTSYVISGGGGADLHSVAIKPFNTISQQRYNYTRVDVNGAQLTLSAKTLDGTSFDQLQVKPLPLLTQSGVVSAANSASGVGAGALTTIYGFNLAVEPQSSTTFPLPTFLGGTSVKIGGELAPLLYVSPTQINCQTPYDLTGSETIEVITVNGSAITNIIVAAAAPAVFAVAYKNAPVSSANPVPAGETVSAFATGLGQVAGGPAAGTPAKSAQNTCLSQISVSMGAATIAPSFAGLAPGYAGLYQVNFAIPAATPKGANAFRLSLLGVTSPPFTLTVG